MATQFASPQPAFMPRRRRAPSYERSPVEPQVEPQMEQPQAEAAPVDPLAQFEDPYGIEAYDKTASPQPSGYARYTGTNLNDMISNDRDLALGRGDELFQNAKDRGADEAQVRSNYRAYGDEVYDPLIGGRGGYSAQEQADIMGDDFSFMTGQDGYDANFLTGDEQNQIRGNPWERAAYFNPDDMVRQNNESAGYQRDAVNQMEAGLNESIDGEKLGMSGDYSRSVDSTLQGTAANVRGAYDPAALRADRTSLDRIRMTPEEEQDIVTSAGISGGMKYRASAGELDRRSRAAGIDPVGAAAMRGRYLREGAATSADAITNARVAASNARAGREGSAESLRMRGESTAADIGTGTEMALGNQALNANTTREGIRIGAQRDISNRLADRATTIGQTRVGTEQGINAQQRQQNQYNASTGTALATGIEQDTAARARDVAGNRQTTNRTNQNQQFQQGMTRNEARSGRATQVAGARRQDAQEGRGYIREQAGVANQNSQNEANRQGQIYATQGQLAQGTTSAQQRKDQQPKWWERAIAATVGATAAAGNAAKVGGG